MFCDPLSCKKQIDGSHVLWLMPSTPCKTVGIFMTSTAAPLGMTPRSWLDLGVLSFLWGLSFLFYDMSTFNEDINGWNTSSVTSMNRMFDGASSFNGDVTNFDTSSVTDMSFMFMYASSFNGDVSNFDTSSVIDMDYMFAGATSFNRDVSSFDISSVTNMAGMFNGATSFNIDLCSWRDSFPYNKAPPRIFYNSGCTYKDTPQEDQKGPFCASDCSISP